jgi:adenosylcobinamide-GDP ribazoletransferase
MAKTDLARRTAADILSALALLTRLPMPAHAPRGAASAWAWPLAGLVVGGLAASVAGAALAAGLSPALAAGLALAMQAMITGAMHEDGLADCADGFWGGWTRDRRLEIMKDSHIGSYGVLALILITGLRWLALAQVLAAGAQGLMVLAAIAALSRAPMAVLATALPNARGTGLSHSVGRPGPRAAALASGLAAAITLLACGPFGAGLLAAALLAATGTALIARAKIGGQTGDVLGATQQVTEAAALIAASALLA